MFFPPKISCSKLILNKQLKRLIETTLGKEFDDIKEQGPAIVEFTDNQITVPHFTAHPSRDAISVFRPLRKSLHWNNGFFKLFSCSHHQTTEQFEAAENKDAHEIIVEPNETLVVAGGVFVQLSPKGGGRMVCQGFSGRMMGKDIYSPLALPFMTI